MVPRSGERLHLTAAFTVLPYGSSPKAVNCSSFPASRDTGPLGSITAVSISAGTIAMLLLVFISPIRASMTVFPAFFAINKPP